MGTAFRARTVTIEPRDQLEFVYDDWNDSVVIVERGALEVECHSGTTAAFTEGAVLAFVGLTPHWLRNAGSIPLVLRSLSRIGSCCPPDR